MFNEDPDPQILVLVFFVDSGGDILRPILILRWYLFIFFIENYCILFELHFLIHGPFNTDKASQRIIELKDYFCDGKVQI